MADHNTSGVAPSSRRHRASRTVTAALFVVAAVTVAGSAVHATARPHARPVLPDHTLTPGATDPAVTQATVGTTICAKGWASKVRPSQQASEQIKRRQFKAYHLTGRLGDYELDHLIPLELGGAPVDVKNLWPEPWERRGHHLAKRGTGAETKDGVENRLHRAVCAGTVPLATAQQAIAADWPKA